jgi:hypothetical protein
MRRFSALLAFSLVALLVNRAFATDWDYTSPGWEASELTSGYGAVGNPSSSSIYNDGAGDYSYPVVVDSGSSTFLMSQTVTQAFNVPLQPGVTYTETGIGGSEVENITQPLTAYYAPASDPNPDMVTSTMTNYGNYTFESRQSDPLGALGIYFDVIGTPIIQHQVMVVNPNQTYDVVNESLGFNDAETVLQPTAPALPAKGTYHVPVTWTNFVTGNPPPSEGDNPVIQNVTARGPSNTDVADNWIFDSGAQFTIISQSYASKLGIDLGDPVTSVTGLGVGSSFVTFDGYEINDIALPLSNGDRLLINDPIVFVPEDASLPAGLDAILGENLWMQTENVDPDTGDVLNTFAAPFSEWYLDGPGNQLVFYDPNSNYEVPEPATLSLLGLAGCFTLWRPKKRRQ